MRGSSTLKRFFALLPALSLGLPCLVTAQAAPPAVITEPPGRSCGPAEQPAELPAGNQVLDSVALVRPLASAARLLLSLRFESGGRQAKVAVLETDRDSAATESLRAAIQAAVRLPQKGIKSVWAVRLRVAGGPRPALTIEPSVFCSAEPKSPAPSGIFSVSHPVDTTLTSDTTGRIPPSDLGRQEVRLTAVLLVSAKGEVTEVELGTSAWPREGAQFTRNWRRIRFLPALLDGFPIAVKYDTESERSTP